MSASPGSCAPSATNSPADAIDEGGKGNARCSTARGALTPDAVRLDPEVGAAEVELTANDLSAIEKAAAEIRIEGERYTEAGLKTVGL